MSKSVVIALYALVLTNIICQAFLYRRLTERFSSADYSKYLVIKESKMASFCNNPCINLKVLNTYKRPLNQVEWSLTFYDTNGLRVVTIADSSWRTFHPKRETDESLELRFSVEEYDLKRYQYRCEVTPGSARVAY